MNMGYQHLPVLLNEVLEAFHPLTDTEEAIFVDGTLGLGGHSLAIASQYKGKSIKYKVLGIDKDSEALKIAANNIKKAGLEEYFTLVHDDFHHIDKILDNLEIKYLDGILLDLGVSSMQLDDKSRGFSFSDPDMPLDMRMDKEQDLSAKNVVNEYSETGLAKILQNGEERYYKKVAKAIVAARKTKPLETVGDLLEVLSPVLKRGYSKTHFATDTFRAIRLEVNDEINSLEDTIEKMIARLKPQGRLAVITFHSIEDRIVKDTFRELANPCTCPPKLPVCACGLTPEVKLINRKPLVASTEELSQNPRARSAKLRIIEKL